ncbi:MAG TPA: type III pantothenate kinase, partial [Gemmatimonadaceae bacterium]|nr:type III pantothenate kinase [Gemmatimonadaceae bacterium]
MIVVFDVGNTETTVGLFDGEALREHWRLTTHVSRTADELAVLLYMLLHARGVSADAITGSAIGSVVPPLTGPLT